MVGVTGSIPVVPTTNFLFSQHFWNHPRPDRLHYREAEETGCFERIQHRWPSARRR